MTNEPRESRPRSVRGLELAALLAPLAFVAVDVVSVVTRVRMEALLPEDPAGFLETLAWVRGNVEALLLPLGFVVTVLWIVDMSRAPDLRGARARFRIAGIVALVGMATVGGIQEGQTDAAIASVPALDGPALHAALAATVPWIWVVASLALAVGACAVGAHLAPRPPDVTTPGPDGRYRSAWIPPVFGATPALPARQWRIIGLMFAAGLFQAYDLQLFSLALKQIQTGLGIEEAQLGFLGSIIRLGVVPGALLALLADSFGRRRLLLLTIVGYTFATGATAFAPDAASFVVCQFLARVFGAAEAILAGVVVAEEIDADQRGWAIGVLSAFAFLGVAFAWMLFASVDVMPGGWRSLYLVGLGPLLFIIWLRRNLPETHRFEGRTLLTSARSSAGDIVGPLRNLVRMYPGRIVAFAAVGFLMAFSGQPAGFFMPKFFQEVHGLAPQQLTLVGAGVGIFGVFAMPLLGRLGDRRGRKPVSIAFIVLNPLAVMGLYLTGGLALPLMFFFGMHLTDIGSDTNLATYARELFPTSYRSTASGTLAMITSIGGSLGLAGESLLYGWLGSHWLAISLLATLGFLVPFIVAFAFPETSGRELEDVSPEIPIPELRAQADLPVPERR